MSIGQGVQEIEVGGVAFVPLSDVVASSGVCERTARARLRLAGVDLWPHPWDRRRKLVRRDDLVRLVQPLQPAAPKAA